MRKKLKRELEIERKVWVSFQLRYLTSRYLKSSVVTLDIPCGLTGNIILQLSGAVNNSAKYLVKSLRFGYVMATKPFLKKLYKWRRYLILFLTPLLLAPLPISLPSKVTKLLSNLPPKHEKMSDVLNVDVEITLEAQRINE